MSRKATVGISEFPFVSDLKNMAIGNTTLGRKANSKNFHDQTSAIPIRNPEDMWIPKMCDIKSVHGPHFEL